MSLLHQDNPEEVNDAALGEEFTKGSSHVVWAALAAFAVVSIAIAIYMIAGQKPPAVTGDIVAVWAHPQHTETSGFDANGAPMPKESIDQVFVFTEVRLHNQSKQPLFLMNILTNATWAVAPYVDLKTGDHHDHDTSIQSSYAASQADYDRVFLAYPGIPVPHGAALPLNLTLEPGQTVDGTFVSSFQMSKQEWDARNDLNFSFTFRYQPGLKLAPHTAVIEQ